MDQIPPRFGLLGGVPCMRIEACATLCRPCMPRLGPTLPHSSPVSTQPGPTQWDWATCCLSSTCPIYCAGRCYLTCRAPHGSEKLPAIKQQLTLPLLSCCQVSGLVENDSMSWRLSTPITKGHRVWLCWIQADVGGCPNCFWVSNCLGKDKTHLVTVWCWEHEWSSV